MRAAFFALAALLACATPAHAERFALSYNGVGLGFVPLGGLQLDAQVSADSYDISATLQARASGRVEQGAVRWQSYELDHYYSRKRRTVAMQPGQDGAAIARIEPNYRLWGEPTTNDEQRRLARDPLSSLVAMAIDVGQTRRCAGAYPTFDGRFYYLLELAGGEIDDFDAAGYEGEVLKCALAYIAVAGFEARDAGRRRIPHGQVWFALMPDTNFAPPVRISTPLSAGGAVIRLARFRRAQVDVETPTP
jgi:hypothetical protein